MKKIAVLIGVAGLAATASAQYNTGIQAGPFNSDGPAGDATNGVFSFTYGASTATFNTVRIRGTATSGGVGSFLSELRWRLALDGGATRDSGQLIPGSTWTGDVPVDNSQPVANFSLTGGNAYSFRFWESFNDGGVDATWTNVQFDLSFTAPVPPPVIANLGTLSDGHAPISVPGTLAASAVNWYSFTAGSGSWEDFWTGITPSVNTDTEIGIYSADGFLVSSLSNDDYSFPSAAWSHLGYGPSLIDPDGPGALVPFASASASQGRYGATSPFTAGNTYYIAIGGFNTTFGTAGFAVTGGATTGPYLLQVIPAPGAAALLGLGGLIAGRRRRA
jgi:MYXO-CTERM domain-containing protein